MLKILLKFRTIHEDERVCGCENIDLKVCKELYEKPIEDYVQEIHMNSLPDPVTESESLYSTNSNYDLSKQHDSSEDNEDEEELYFNNQVY